MNYVQLVEKHSISLGDLSKMCHDLARILDNEITQLKKGDHSWNGPLNERIGVFNQLCAIFASVGVEIPPLEEELWRASLPHTWSQSKFEEAKERAEQVRTQVRKHLSGHQGSTAYSIRALMEMIVLFPECGDFSHQVSMANILAMANHLLVDELGLDPFRPDYSTMKVPVPIDSNGPSRSIKVLIVDDSLDALLESAVKLVGIPNIVVDMFCYTGENMWEKLAGDARDKKLFEVAQAIISLNPDLILMDQGLGNIDGHDLVATIQQIAETNFIFVANTDGDARDLNSVGCYANFKKGKIPQAMVSALRII